MTPYAEFLLGLLAFLVPIVAFAAVVVLIRLLRWMDEE